MNSRHVRLKAEAAVRLGLTNVARLLWYKAQLKNGIGPVLLKPEVVALGEFFSAPKTSNQRLHPPPIIPLRYFGWLELELELDGTPDWFLNPVTGQHFSPVNVPWHTLPDFDPGFGDIKWVWELSRWDWVVKLAQHIKVGGDSTLLKTLNRWLRHWLQQNPLYRGPNWKCGQEASIRLLHLAFAARMLGQTETTSTSLIQLVSAHLRRIAVSTNYAVAQDNNHGTSEGAALFVGGTWLARCNSGDDRGRFAAKGRQLLENRVARLVMRDGTFSQYSVNYHRMMLDTLSLAEIWRRSTGEPVFSDTFYDRARAASEWLRTMVDTETGDAPNIGANDGARLLPLTGGYRDYRPSVQLACVLFLNRRAYPAGPWDDHLRWLDLEPVQQRALATSSRTFAEGGFAVLCTDEVKVVTRFPRFRFRPSHADALHVDLWYRGHNILCDSGTYSYNTATDRMSYFAGCAGHNTIEFDDHDQMPKLSRFLYGRWLTTNSLEPVREDDDGRLSWRAGYRDWTGAEHRRAVVLSTNTCRVIDNVAGFKTHAILRWHLCPGAWTLEHNVLSGEGIRISLQADTPIRGLKLVEREASLYYGHSHRIPVLEAELNSPSTVETTIAWSSTAGASNSLQETTLSRRSP